MGRDSLVKNLALAQYGLVTRRQALAAGLGGGSLDCRLRRGDWEQVGWGVYRLSGAVPGWHQSALAMCLQAEPYAALSHRSAAFVWGLDGIARFPPQPIEILVPHGRELKTWAMVRTSRHFERGVHRSMPVTPLSRTIVDLSSVLEPTALEAALHSALRMGPRALAAIKARLQRSPGARQLRELMKAYDGTLDSELEVLVRKLLWAAGLPRPKLHFNVWHQKRWLANVDFAWPGQKLVLQAHGKKWHLNPRRWEIDLRQQNQMTTAGWLPLTTTWKEVNEHPARFVAMMRETWENVSRPSLDVAGKFRTGTEIPSQTT